MTNPPRNRIKDHLLVRGKDLVPHEMNPRNHDETQRAALQALYNEIGFARSVLAYELPDGRLKLIDGHLRVAMNPDHHVEVEVLDVNDAEARALLLAIDPLAQLAKYDAQMLADLREVAERDSAAVCDLWRSIEASSERVRDELEAAANASCDEALAEKFVIVIECENESQQTELLERLQGEGLSCQALVT